MYRRRRIKKVPPASARTDNAATNCVLYALEMSASHWLLSFLEIRSGNELRRSNAISAFSEDVEPELSELVKFEPSTLPVLSDGEPEEPEEPELSEELPDDDDDDPELAEPELDPELDEPPLDDESEDSPGALGAS